jgi:hypothetical protein
MVGYFKANHKGLLCHSNATSLAEPLDMSISQIDGVFIRKSFVPKGHCMLLRDHVFDELQQIRAQKRQIFNK